VEEGRRGEAREESFYPFLGTLLEAMAVRLGRPEVRAMVIPRKTDACLLDLQIRDGPHAILGYVEAKRPGTDLDRAEESPQVRRYRQTFPNLFLTNFSEIRLFRRGARVGAVRLDGPGGEEGLLGLLGDFLAFRSPPSLDSAALAVALAGRARVLAARIGQRLERELAGGTASRLSGFYQAFRQYLLSRLAVHEFADLYAQTIAYGLLAARWENPGLTFDRRGAFDRVPLASGILRDVFCFIAMGSMPPEIEWIVDDLVDLLSRSTLPDFSRLRPAEPTVLAGKNPLLHFYETFLRAYDPGLRKRRGVFYTPLPVISYIVRSVDLLLRHRLGWPLGLADAGVRLLDPAAGTMTFVAEACRRAAATCRKERGGAAVPALVRDHLLPHFIGFELMMAPYAIGHLQMSMALASLGHRPGEGERVHLYLTDALHHEKTAQTTLPGVDALAHESQAADLIKEDAPVNVVIGNPPWAGHSANPDAAYNKLLDGYRLADGRTDEGYFRVDGEGLAERNPKWLRDDYVKFLRFAQWKIDENGEGIVGLVTNHGWLDGATFRGMRRSLLRTFDEVYVLDLHGNRRRREVCPGQPGPDANVFGIEQGVAIVLLVKKPGLARKVFRADLRGNRAYKLRWLAGQTVESTLWAEVEPGGPSWLIMRGDADLEAAYGRGLPLPRIFDVHSAGLMTGRDALVTGVDPARLRRRVEELRRELLRGEAGDRQTIDAWRLTPERLRRARADTAWADRFTTFLARPFDERHLFAAEWALERPREAVLRHLRQPGNLALVVPRQHKEEAGALVTAGLAGHKAVSAHDVNSVFPLWREPAGALGGGRTPNLTLHVRRLLAELYGEEPAPEEVLACVYAVLWTPTYRERYADFLRRDFPRIPFPPGRQAFDRLAALGKELIDLHLLRDPRLAGSPVRFVGDGERPLAKGRRARIYQMKEARVLLDGEALAFEGIENPVWERRIGGYQVLDRWLAARAGYRLGSEEIERFRRIVAALDRTREVERRLDEAFSV